MSEQINQSVLKNSIVLIGPAGVGKSTVARELGRIKNMPVVTLDLLRHCPASLTEIESRKAHLEMRHDEIKQEINSSGSDRLRSELIRDMMDLDNEIWVCGEQLKLRKMFPNVSNYEAMGFNGEVSHFIEDNFGKIAWHFYQKQFENMLLEQVMLAATEPCIFDLGGGMAVSLDEDYKALATKFKALDAERGSKNFEENFNLDKIGFEHIKNLLSQFSHVVSLELPEDYIYRDNRSAKDPLNSAFIASGQFDELATDESHKIDVGNLVLTRGEINKDRLAEIVNEITALSTQSKIKK